MIRVIWENVDGKKLDREWNTVKEFLDEQMDDKKCMGDDIILLAALDSLVIYTSLYRKAEGEGGNIRTCDLIDWLKRYIEPPYRSEETVEE